jgi:hypothetical protein
MSVGTIGGVERLKLSHPEYRDYPAVSQSDLKGAWTSPQLYWQVHVVKSRPKTPPTDAMQWGTDCEAYLRHGQLADVIEIPDWVLNKDGHRKGKEWTSWSAQFAGSRLVKAGEYEQLMDGYVSAHANVCDHGVARTLVDEALADEWQQQFAWYDAEHDLPMKAELDIVREDLSCVVDIKTAADTAIDPFLRKAIDLGYDIQAAHYLEVIERLMGRPFNFAWVVIRNKPPYDVEVYEASDELLAIGQARLEERKHWFKVCRDTGVWRSRTHGLMQTLYPPRWLKGTIL